MKKGIVIATGLAGLTAAILLIVYQGVAEVLGHLVDTGWGLLLVTLFHVIPLILSAKGLQVLITGHRVDLLTITNIRWIREGIASLLPVAQVGGDFVGARLLTFYNVPGGVAGGSSVVSLTMEVLTQFLFTVLGFGLLFLFLVLGGRELEGFYWMLLGLLVALLALLGFVIAQQSGFFRLVERLFNRMTKGHDLEWLGIGELSGLHEAIRTIYRSPRALTASAFYHFFSWVTGAGEVWILFYFMGYPLSIWDALILETVGKAVRSAAFIVPSGWGVVEGALMLFAPLLGLTPELGLALSLGKRVREVALGVPSLFAWHVIEGRRLWKRNNP